jgi:hypothetical protein
MRVMGCWGRGCASVWETTVGRCPSVHCHISTAAWLVSNEGQPFILQLILEQCWLAHLVSVKNNSMSTCLWFGLPPAYTGSSGQAQPSLLALQCMLGHLWCVVVPVSLVWEISRVFLPGKWKNHAGLGMQGFHGVFALSFPSPFKDLAINSLWHNGKNTFGLWLWFLAHSS